MALYAKIGKRVCDVIAAIIALIVLSPLLLAIAVLVRLVLGRPVLFRQQRPGKNAVPFQILKFRTMFERHDDAGRLLPDALRLGWLGRFLRATSLDELPELFNVLRGEMSFVGPRPLLTEYLPLYSPTQSRRHEVLPGITGLAQVNGRNATSWQEKFRMDVWYVDHVSLALDLRILLKTIGTVMLARDISQPGHATAAAFTGNQNDANVKNDSSSVISPEGRSLSAPMHSDQ